MPSGRTRDVRRVDLGQWLFALIVFVVVPVMATASLVGQRPSYPGPPRTVPVREFYGDPKTPGIPRRAPLDLPIRPEPPLDLGPIKPTPPYRIR